MVIVINSRNIVPKTQCVSLSREHSACSPQPASNAKETELLQLNSALTALTDNSVGREILKDSQQRMTQIFDDLVVSYKDHAMPGMACDTVENHRGVWDATLGSQSKLDSFICVHGRNRIFVLKIDPQGARSTTRCISWCKFRVRRLAVLASISAEVSTNTLTFESRQLARYFVQSIAAA